MSKKSVWDPVTFDSPSSSSHFDPVDFGSGGSSSNAFEPVSWDSNSSGASGHWAPVDNYGSRDKLSSHFSPTSVSSDGRGSAFSTLGHRNWGGEPIQNYPERHAYHGVSDSHYSTISSATSLVGSSVWGPKKS